MSTDIVLEIDVEADVDIEVQPELEAEVEIQPEIEIVVEMERLDVNIELEGEVPDIKFEDGQTIEANIEQPILEVEFGGAIEADDSWRVWLYLSLGILFTFCTVINLYAILERILLSHSEKVPVDSLIFFLCIAGVCIEAGLSILFYSCYCKQKKGQPETINDSLLADSKNYKKSSLFDVESGGSVNVEQVVDQPEVEIQFDAPTLEVEIELELPPQVEIEVEVVEEVKVEVGADVEIKVEVE